MSTQLKPEEVSEIVLVGADGDYFGCLKEKKDAGVAVYLVATDLSDPESNNRSSLSGTMREEFEFVELNQFKDTIMVQAWQDRLSRRENAEFYKSKPRGATTAEIKIRFAGNASHAASLYSDITGLISKYRGLEIQSSVISDDSDL